MIAAWIYTLIPATVAILGAVVAVNVRPGPTLVSAIQHFAAGVVFAAAAGEIMPDVAHSGSPIATIVGGFAGIGVMLAIRQLERVIKGPAGLLTLVGVDILIDGLVLGIAFAAGAKAGLLLTIALSVEVLFLGLAVTTELSETVKSRMRIVLIIAALVVLLPVGAFIATPVASLPAHYITGFLSFGLIALLYLVTEELLVEAHETPDRPWVTAMFFVGFLLLLSLEEVMG
ncbi:MULTISPECIES: ZIP family metal transporter [Rhodobacterales]|uniref:Transporter n=1 Tax=Pelagivirga sediminicola TaxID=2170575 RepID=A0A2T7G2T3_9RHOB|nr:MULTISPECIES: transporter [Rhodobacterales]MCQ0090314.1 transporter [Roseovarius sp. M141]PVA08731.1 transporter [Pelagivirga sediminicola]